MFAFFDSFSAELLVFFQEFSVCCLFHVFLLDSLRVSLLFFWIVLSLCSVSRLFEIFQSCMLFFRESCVSIVDCLSFWDVSSLM